MHQLGLFGAGRSERDRILAALADKHTTYLEFCRAIAREIAARSGSVSIDEVRAELTERDLPMPAEIGCDERVFGALFKAPGFHVIGRRVTSRAAVAQRVGRARSEVTVYEFRAVRA